MEYLIIKDIKKSNVNKTGLVRIGSFQSRYNVRQMEIFGIDIMVNKRYNSIITNQQSNIFGRVGVQIWQTFKRFQFPKRQKQSRFSSDRSPLRTAT